MGKEDDQMMTAHKTRDCYLIWTLSQSLLVGVGRQSIYWRETH